MKKTLLFACILSLLIIHHTKGQFYTDWTAFEYDVVTPEDGVSDEGVYEIRKDYTLSLPSLFQDQSKMPGKGGQIYDMYRGDAEDYYNWASKLPVIEWDFLRIEPGGILTIKRGYRWDGASNPVSLMKHHNYRSSLVHDALYDLMRMGYLLPDTNHQGTCWDAHSKWGDGDYNRAMADIIHYMIARQDGDGKTGAQSDFRTIRKMGPCKSHNDGMLFGGKYHVSELSAYSSDNKIALEWRPQNLSQKDPDPILFYQYKVLRNGQVYDTINNIISFSPLVVKTSYEDLNAEYGEHYYYQLMPIAYGGDIGRKSWSNIEFVVHDKGAGNALQFDGVDDYFTSRTVCNDLCYNPDSELSPSSFTVEAWVYPEEKAGMNALVAFNTIGGGNLNILMYDGDNQKFCYYDDDREHLLSRDVFPENEWYHVSLVIDNLNRGSLYVNKTEQITFETDVRSSHGGRFSLGQEWDNEEPSQFFKGAMDEVRIWNRALTREEIEASMYRPLLGSEANLISLWHFDEPNEQFPDFLGFSFPEKAYDASSNANDEFVTGSHNSSITFIPSGAMQIPSTIEDISVNEGSGNKQIRNYPNPFSSFTVIEYSKPNEEEVEIRIFDMAGRIIKTFRENSMQGEQGKIPWDGTSENGNAVDSGVYFCQLRAGTYTETIKIILLR